MSADTTLTPRVSVITLGVDDLPRARRFYEQGLGWAASAMSNDNIAFFQAGGQVVALFGRDALADDAGLSPPPTQPGFCGVTLAHNVRERDDVARVLDAARRAGATILKPAQDVFWGGHHGYFADPDGHVWEVAWNPHFPLGRDGAVHLPR